jgi:hypothetical protein
VTHDGPCIDRSGVYNAPEEVSVTGTTDDAEPTRISATGKDFDEAADRLEAKVKMRAHAVKAVHALDRAGFDSDAQDRILNALDEAGVTLVPIEDDLATLPFTDRPVYVGEMGETSEGFDFGVRGDVTMKCQLCGGDHLSASVHSYEELQAWEADHPTRPSDSVRTPREAWIAGYYAGRADREEGRGVVDVGKLADLYAPGTPDLVPSSSEMLGSVRQFIADQWGDMADRLESLWDRFGSEEAQDLYFALDDARDRRDAWTLAAKGVSGQVPAAVGPGDDRDAGATAVPTKVLVEARKELAALAVDTGDDHSVGICSCALRELVTALGVALEDPEAVRALAVEREYDRGVWNDHVDGLEQEVAGGIDGEPYRNLADNRRAHEALKSLAAAARGRTPDA